MISEPDNFFDLSLSASKLLETIRRAGTIARSELPSWTGLSQQSVHRLTEDLLARDLIQTSSAKVNGRGKPSPRLSLNPDGGFGFGISVDTDMVSAAIADLSGNVLFQTDLEVDSIDPKAVANAARETQEAAFVALNLPRERFAGVGVSMQGYRTISKTMFTPPIPLSAWNGIETEAYFADPAYPAVYVENNATLGAIAELWVGVGRHHRHFAYLSFNFGFGGGLVLNGEPFLGQNLNAGEISGLYTEAESSNRPALSGFLELLRAHDVQMDSLGQLREEFDPEWAATRIWLDRVTPELNRMVRAMTSILDPGAIVYGGEAPRALRQALIERTAARPLDRFGRALPEPQLVLSEIEINPSLLGAALLPIRSRLF